MISLLAFFEKKIKYFLDEAEVTDERGNIVLRKGIFALF